MTITKINAGEIEVTEQVKTRVSKIELDKAILLLENQLKIKKDLLKEFDVVDDGKEETPIEYEDI